MSGNSTAASVSSSSNNGLTGWAAFRAKTSSAGPSTAKMGSATQSTSGKPVTGSNNQKPTGLSTTKGVGSKITSASSTNPSQLKPLPPLTLGKVGLSRSVSSDNVSKIGLPNAGSSTPGNSPTIGGNGSSVAAGSSTSKSSTESGNQSPSLKGPTSQESQLNAMKRLQMVKKKAAQKKLKK